MERLSHSEGGELLCVPPPRAGMEGGFSNDPSDPAGATNWGITAATLAHWRALRVNCGSAVCLIRLRSYRPIPSHLAEYPLQHPIRRGPRRVAWPVPQADFLAASNCARHLMTPCGLSPGEYICKTLVFIRPAPSRTNRWLIGLNKSRD